MDSLELMQPQPIKDQLDSTIKIEWQSFSISQNLNIAQNGKKLLSLVSLMGMEE